MADTFVTVKGRRGKVLDQKVVGLKKDYDGIYWLVEWNDDKSYNWYKLP